MSQNSISGGSSVSGSGSSSHSGFQKPVSLDGPETVINPERRGLVGNSGSEPRLSGSSIWSRLFPHDAATGTEFGSGPVGCRLGHFLIESTIGAGGMGAVFRAVDERLDRIVALKVLSPSLGTRDPAALQRFINEARSAARLDHDNIARVFYVGEDRGLHFIAHEFVTGRNIRDMIRATGPLDPREAVNYTLQLATALRHTAAAGVVHRDIKPSNVIVTPRGRAKLVDLGLAKKVASESFGDLTIAGTTLGTFDYISPEQAKDPRNVDVRSDIYSLGCTLYHMLAGEPPYPEGTVLQKLLDHQAKDVPDASRKNPRTPPRLAAVVRKMMAPDPRDRYATPDDLILDMLPIAAEMGLRGINPEGLVWTSQPLGTRSFLERNVAWIFAGAALLLIAFLVDRFSDRAHDLPFVKRAAPSQSPAGGTAGQKSGDSVELGGPARASAPANTSSEPAAPPSKPDAKTEVADADGAAVKNSAAKATDGGSLDKVPPWKLLNEPDKIFSGAGSKPALSPANGVATAAQATPARSESANPSAKELDKTASPSAAAAPSAGPPAPEISITEYGVTTPYATLEAAVADAKDGSSIDLKFNGPRSVSEKPFRVSGKRITIRGGKGFRPLISFSPRELPAIGFESRMITLNNGTMELVDVDILAVVPEATVADHWSLFSLGGPDRLRWRGVNITVTNPGNRRAEIVDVSSNRDQLPPISARQAGPMAAPQEFEVKAEHSFVRGSCALFAVRTTAGGRLDVKDCAAALQGPFLANWGDDDSPGETRHLEMHLEHLTCLLSDGLIQMDGGDVPRFLLPLDVEARNNIFASNSQTPLVSLSSRTNDDPFPRLFHWDGTRNFYDRFATFWTTGGTNAPLPFEEWKRLWGEKEIDPNNNGIVWKHPWQNKPPAAVRLSDFELASVNQAISGATDNLDVGADLTTIRPMTEPAPAN